MIFSPARKWSTIVMIGSLAVFMYGCSSGPQKTLTFQLKDQDVPVVLMVGPFQTATVTYDGGPLTPDIEDAIKATFQSSLKAAGVFKDVKVLVVKRVAGTSWDSENLLDMARAEQADLLLMGSVKEFDASMSLPVPKRNFHVKMRLITELYNVQTKRQVWRKSENVQLSREGWGGKDKLREIVAEHVVRALVAGTVPSMIGQVQAAYLDKGKSVTQNQQAEFAGSIFGGEELMRIDLELAPLVTLTPGKDHAYAVIFGVEHYRDLPQVDYATRDAEMIKKYLVQTLGYREQNIVLLLNDRVTRSQIEARLEKWLPKQVNNDANSEVFVYYGGHGAPDPETNQSFLVPYDGDPSFLETTAYPLKRLYQVLKELPSKQVTVVLDSCFSGAGGRSVIAKGARPMLITVDSPVVSSQNLTVFTAAAGNQISSAYQEKRYGLFTYFFLKGLQGGADLNKDGVIRVRELDEYVKTQVQTEARRMNVDQVPQILPGLDVMGGRADRELVRLR
ncbi:MAG: caspase family protein [Nitrospira sp.]